MIDKIQPRKLDKDSDSKLVQKTSMVDALNVYIDESLSGSEGNSGVLKPILGNTQVGYGTSSNPFDGAEGTFTDASFRVLGHAVDEMTNVVYYFVWSDNADEQGVYAYDPDGMLPGGEAGVVRLVFATKLFNFDPQSFVNANVIHKTPGSQRSESYTSTESDAILYFTDGVNEPRKLDVYKSMTMDLSGRSDFNINDYICACPKVPMGNVDFEFDSNPAVKVSNFESSPGLQFAIQGVYYDGSTTAIGPYSPIAFSPSIVNRGAKESANTLKYNRCKIKVPTLPDEIEFVKILFRQGNGANFLEIAEVPNAGTDLSDPNWVNDELDRYYSFYNNTVALGVAPSEVSKIYDAVPRSAHQQTVASNRLVYGNFKEGYDRTSLNASIFPIYKDRPAEGVDFFVGAVPSITTVEGPAGGGSNVASGFEIDASEIPDEIPAESVIEFAVSMAPDKNFHVYEGKYSYHQTLVRGWSMLNLRGYPREINDNVKNNPNPVSFLAQGGPAWSQESGSGYSRSSYERASQDYEVRSLSDAWVHGELNDHRARSLFGQNFGVGIRVDEGTGLAGQANTGPFSFPVDSSPSSQQPMVWRYVKPDGTVENKVMSFGTSASNPLIIQGGLVKFNVKFKILEDTANGVQVVRDFIESYMGGEGNPFPSLVEVDEEASQTKWVHDVDVNLYNKQQLGDVERSLITSCCYTGKTTTNHSVIDNRDNIISERQRAIPAAHFILNKGQVTFSLQKANSDDTPRKTLHLRIDDISVDSSEGLFTCVRRPDPGSPWWAISPDQVDSLISSSTSEAWDALENSMDYSDKIFDNSGFSFSLEGIEENAAAFSYGQSAFGRFLYKERDETMEEAYASREFWPCKIDEGNTKFRFSLLDGAAGPGGENPGDSSAYAVYNHAKQGSVTGQVIFTHYGVPYKEDWSVSYFKNQLRSDVRRLLPFSNQRERSVMIGGQLDGFDENGVFAGDNSVAILQIGSLGACVNKNRAQASGIPSDRECRDAIGGNAAGSGSTEEFPVMAVFSGPFFTGKIQMNPIYSPANSEDLDVIANATQDGDSDLATKFSGGWYYDDVGGPSTYNFLNGYALGNNTLNAIDCPWLPPVVDQTTVLPYVFYSDLNQAAIDNFKVYATSYPYPITDQDSHDQVGLDFENGLISSEEFYSTVEVDLNPDPFDAYIDPENPVGYNADHKGFGGISYGKLSPHVEVISAETNSSTSSDLPIMSFKSNATHEFGIVYFDERGRRGPVNYIGSVFIPGYSMEDGRPNEIGGPVFVGIDLTTSTPPSWAHHYKVVYTKNTSMSEFFQYSTEGAYITQAEDPDGKVYMSLNYLQGHPISYSDSWGARSQDGSPVVFQPESGDKLRIISYNSIVNGDEEAKIFPSNIVFDVVGIESLGSDGNPLLASGATEETDDRYYSKQGLFLVLRDNPENEGFAYRNVENNNSFWNQNVIFEIYRPVKGIDEESRLYYEVGPTYSVGLDEGGSTVHLNEKNESGIIEFFHGDVFFRLSAVNQKDVEDGTHKNLITEFIQFQEPITDDEGNVIQTGYRPESSPNFKSVYLEASSASDLFKSDAISIGRPCSIDANDRERIRPASLIHSDKDLPKKRTLGYSSFNPSQADDKDLEQSHGAIRYMAFTDDSIMILQERKVGHIPVDRNIISTADNEPSLIASSTVLGTPRYYAGEAGTDHPESVSLVDSVAYFVNSKLGKVFRASGSNGVMDISAKGMSTFFRDLLSTAASAGNIMKFFGGFDPKKSEYLLTSKELSVEAQSGSSIDQTASPAQEFGANPGQDVVVIDGITNIPDGLEDDPRFRSEAIVPLDQYYAKCCVIEEPFSPVKIALESISDEMGVSFTINASMLINLDTWVSADTQVTAGEMNSMITNSLRISGTQDAEGNPITVAPFDAASGLNLHFLFQSDCPDNDTEEVVSTVSEFRTWVVDTWKGPDVFSPAARGTGFAAEEMIVKVIDILETEEQCFVPFTDDQSLLEYWNGEADSRWNFTSWNAIGEMIPTNAVIGNSGYVLDGTWDTHSDRTGTFPSVIKNGSELRAYLSLFGGSDGFDNPIDWFELAISAGLIEDYTTADVIDFLNNYSASEDGAPATFYDIPYNQLFQDDHGGPADDYVFGDNNANNYVTQLLRGGESFTENGIPLFRIHDAVKVALEEYAGFLIDPDIEGLEQLCFYANGRPVYGFSDFGQGQSGLG